MPRHTRQKLQKLAALALAGEGDLTEQVRVNAVFVSLGYLYTTHAASDLNVPLETLFQFILEGKVDAIRVGTERLVCGKSVQRLARAREKELHDTLVAEGLLPAPVKRAPTPRKRRA